MSKSASDGTEKRKRGRPKSEGGGRGAALTISINPRVRARLEVVAAQSERSLSQTAERLIEDALDGRAGIVELLGGLEVAGTVQEMILAANRIRDDFGLPLSSDAGHRLLLTVWQQIIEATPVPFPTPQQHDELIAREAWREAMQAHEAAPSDRAAERRAAAANRAHEAAFEALAQYELDLERKAKALIELMRTKRA